MLRAVCCPGIVWKRKVSGKLSHPRTGDRRSQRPSTDDSRTSEGRVRVKTMIALKFCVELLYYPAFGSPGQRDSPPGCAKVKINHLKPRLVLISRTNSSLAVHIRRAKFMRKQLVAAILSVGLLAGTAVPVIAATSQSQKKKRRTSSSRRRRARNVGIGAAGGAATGAILGRGRGAAAGATIGGTAGALTPTRRRGTSRRPSNPR